MLDLDGTIIQGGVEVTPRVRTALRRAHDFGCLLAVSSGRPLGMVPRAVRRLGVMDYYLCGNGAKVYDARGKELFARTFSRDEVLRLMEAVAPFEPRWNTHIDGHCYIERTGFTYMGVTRARIRKMIPRSPRQLKLRLRDLKHRFFGEQGKRIVASIDPIVNKNERFEKVGCSFASPEACDGAVDAIEALGGYEVARVWARELEITVEGVTKGTTADWLLEHAGVARERTVAFGDSTNDAPLIGHVGRFVAMGNADEALKEMADETCATLAQDGVALWLEEQMGIR